jgi:phage FluMu protein Com
MLLVQPVNLTESMATIRIAPTHLFKRVAHYSFNIKNSLNDTIVRLSTPCRQMLRDPPAVCHRVTFSFLLKKKSVYCRKINETEKKRSAYGSVRIGDKGKKKMKANHNASK